MIATRDSHDRIFVHGQVFNAAPNSPDPTNTAAERYDPSTQVWSVLGSSAQYTSFNAWTIDATDRVLVWGGIVITSGGSVFNATPRGQLYDPAANTWTSVPSAPTSPFYQGRQAMFFWGDGSGTLWVAGGFCGLTNPAQDFTSVPTGNSFFLFNTAMKYSGGPAGAWTLLSASPDYSTGTGFGDNSWMPFGAPRDDSNQAYLFPDSAGAGTIFYERYTPAADSWLTLSKTGSPVSTNAISAVVLNSQVYVLNRSTGAFARYDMLANTWTSLTTPGHGGGTLFVVGGNIYLVGATDRFGLVTNALYSYDTGANAWTTLADALSDTRQPAVVPTSIGAYFIGGAHDDGTSSTTVEFWQPLIRKGRAWGQVIG